MTSPYLQSAAAQTRTEEEVRAVRRERALAEIRAIGKTEGISERILDESEVSMRSAFTLADLMDSLLRARR